MEDPTGHPDIWIQTYRAEKRFKKTLDHFLRKSFRSQKIKGQAVGRLEKVADGPPANLLGQPDHPQTVSEVPDRCQQGSQNILGPASGVRHAVKTALGPDDRSRGEGLQLKSLIIQDPLGLRVSRLQHLESVIQQKAIHLIGLEPPANAVASLQDQDRQLALLQPTGTTQSRQSGADDDDVMPARWHISLR